MDKLKRANLRVKKSEAKLAGIRRQKKDLMKKIVDGDKKQTELYQKWFDRLEALRKSLDEALQVDMSNLKVNKQFLSTQLQKISKTRQKLQELKDKDVLEQDAQNRFYSGYVEKLIGPNNSDKVILTKHHRLRITVRFWDELFEASPAGEVERTIKLYLETIAEAEKNISQSQAKSQELADKISAILQKAEDDKMLAIRLGSDLGKIKNFQQKLKSDNLKPRDLRQIEYDLNKIQKKYDL